ncbi:MAG TPA: methyltransferase domain-containing protein [Pyrinomonadaceae bacterium]|nr:methyltransferase domain-containing protein [Pyrinomonadaceae bacterium]
MNFFSPKSAAERYAAGRIYFHPLVVGRIRELLSLREPVARALDVGCGTGLSSVALKEIAREVVGLDASQEMLAHAPRDAGLVYLCAVAERLPFAARRFDLLTMSQVFHWVEVRAFFAEAARVLRARGWLVVYDNYMTGRMRGNDEFEAWFREAYLRRYPSPPRGALSFDEEETRGAGFELFAHERQASAVEFSVAGLVDFLSTQSNVIAAVEGRGEEIDAAKEWLTKGIRPHFGEAARAEFLFDAPIWCLRSVV